jgi:hypothetical protein|tara:strand:- start:1824 stop:2153 length:330 start_codon:yes stop_codon:yes gene_type:complete
MPKKMIHSVQQIKFEIFKYIKEFGANFEDWVVGVSNDPKTEMFERHKVNDEKDIWLYKQAVSFSACRTVQKYFINNLKTDGILVLEGDENTDCIYLFKKSTTTFPRSLK